MEGNDTHTPKKKTAKRRKEYFCADAGPMRPWLKEKKGMGTLTRMPRITTGKTPPPKERGKRETT